VSFNHIYKCFYTNFFQWATPRLDARSLSSERTLVETLAIMVEATWAMVVMVARTASVLCLPETMDGLEYEVGVLW
jgi:hypothetical protein